MKILKHEFTFIFNSRNFYGKYTLLNFLLGYGALPMYFDLMGPHFVIAARNNMGNDWYEALEYHWLALFELVIYIMKFGWHLQRADVQNKAQSQ